MKATKKKKKEARKSTKNTGKPNHKYMYLEINDSPPSPTPVRGGGGHIGMTAKLMVRLTVRLHQLGHMTPGQEQVCSLLGFPHVPE